MDTVFGLLDDAATRAPEREAVAWAPRDTVTARWTWAQLRDASRDAARRLAGLGVGKGTRVGLLCPNRPEWLAVAFGALRLGGVLVPLSTLWTRDEIAYALRHADVEVLVTVAGFLRHDYLAHLRAIVPDLGGDIRSPDVPALRRVVLLDGDAPGLARWSHLPLALDLVMLDALEAQVAPTDIATVFFTSGTTAKAKAVAHAHRALAISGRRIADAVGIGPDDAWWGHMPLFWSGGFVLGALATIAGGGRLVLHEVVEPRAALALLEVERCTVMAGWHQAGPLLDHPDFGSRRLALHKGSWHPLADRLMGSGHVAVGMYGMSETATCVACARWDDAAEVRATTFGRPLAGMEVRIADPETGRALAPGETGEIQVRGPTLMEGYLRVPRADTLTADGYFRTGDLGFVDAEGYLHFGSRLKDVIKTAGVNVAASEVEEALARHPDVGDAFVVGVPDPVRGENVAAFVVARPGATIDLEALRAFCREALASYKIPRHMFAIEAKDVPRTGTGKVEKPALRRMAEARLAG